jgi:hypothetical protein
MMKIQCRKGVQKEQRSGSAARVELAIRAAPVPRKYPRFPGRPVRSRLLYRLAYPGSNGEQHQSGSSLITFLYLHPHAMKAHGGMEV